MDEIEDFIEKMEIERKKRHEDALNKKSDIIEKALDEARVNKISSLQNARDTAQNLVDESIKEYSKYKDKRILQNKKELKEISSISKAKQKEAIELIKNEVLED